MIFMFIFIGVIGIIIFIIGIWFINCIKICWIVFVIIIFFFIVGFVVFCNVDCFNMVGLMVLFYIVYLLVGICELFK